MADTSGNGRLYFLPLAVKTISLIAIYATYGVLQENHQGPLPKHEE
jgi:hypothetical protein